MTDINGAHVTELAVRLQKFFANQQRVTTAIVHALSSVRQDALHYQTAWKGPGLAPLGYQIDALVEALGNIRMACCTVRDTAPLAEQDLLELLALVGVELGAQP